MIRSAPVAHGVVGPNLPLTTWLAGAKRTCMASTIDICWGNGTSLEATVNRMPGSDESRQLRYLEEMWSA